MITNQSEDVHIIYPSDVPHHHLAALQCPPTSLIAAFAASCVPSFTFDFDFRFWKFPYNPNRSRQCAPQNVRSLRRMLSLYRGVCTWAAVHQQGPPLLQPPRPTDCQYSPHHNHRIRRPLGRAAGCRVVTAARFPRVRTNYRQHGTQHPA